MSSDILVIVPLHKFNDDVKNLLTDAIKSVPEDIDIVISTISSVEKELKAYVEAFKNVSVKTSRKKATDFCTLVNNAVDENYKWFSILEYDDEYTPIWFNNVRTYIDFKPDYSVFFPLNDLVEYNSKQYVGFGNEAVWASSFSNDIGVIDLDCLQSYFDFYPTGAVFNTADWKELKGLKTNIKLYFWYELMMRFAQKGKKLYVIPKVGYVHYVGRPDSLMDEYKNTLSNDEAKYWLSVAKKEYFFVTEREVKTFEESKEKEEED